MGADVEKKSLVRELYKQCIEPVLPSALALKLKFYSKHGYWPDLDRPRSLMEKIVWLLQHDRNPARAVVADRCKVREFVQERAPECRIPAHLWVGTEFSRTVWESLPAKFVVKGNHGSQMTRIVDKSRDSFESVRADTLRWLTTDYASFFGEWVYAQADRKIVVEEKLEIEEIIPPDWKFMCGNGRVLLVQLDIGRFVNHVRNLYDRDFALFEGATIAFPLGPAVAKPRAWEKAVAIAEKLAEPFDLIRVDLYLMGDEVYFGELTNYPGAGWDALKPASLDFELGSKIELYGCR